MGKLIYSTLGSLDGYVVDEHGNFDWAAPDEDVHAHVNELSRPVGTFLFGRRMYETLAVWDTMDERPDKPPVVYGFAEIWKAADKVVFSRTLKAVSTARTRIEREFDPELVRRMKAESDRDLSIGGPTLAARAIETGLVDEWQLYLMPIVVGGGTRALPDGVRVELDLLDERRFAGGAVHLRYRTRV
jgi:dihydrofolate reductase